MQNSQIEWTDNTFNPWWGCMKVSEGCKNCYAETLDNRYNHADPHWGPNSPRKPMSEAYWMQPFKWDADAKKAGIKAKVFCTSMADVFEDNIQVIDWRRRLFNVIEHTPNLIWQLLTKRPENILKLVPEHWSVTGWPDNVWMGTTVENQEAADKRIPVLLDVPANVRFLSCEPLLGQIDLTNIRIPPVGMDYHRLNVLNSTALSRVWSESGRPMRVMETNDFGKVDWVICGGESGNGTGIRPMHPDWARSLRDQCTAAGVPFFFKQWGEYLPGCQFTNQEGKGATVQFQSPNNPEKLNTYFKLGKKANGSLLDDREWKEFPK